MDPYGGPSGGAGGWGHGPHWGGLPPGMSMAGSMPSGMSCSMSGSIPSGMHCMGPLGGPHLPLGGTLGGTLGGPPPPFMGSMPSVHGGLTPSGMPPGGLPPGMHPHGPPPHIMETYRNSCPVHSPYRFHFANGGPGYFSQQVSEWCVTHLDTWAQPGPAGS